MARTSMAELITRLRIMIGDDGTTQEFTDAHIQDICDQHKTTYRYEPLTAIEDISTGGTVQFLEFWSGRRHWEGTADSNLVFQDGTWGTVTPTTFNYIEGKFRFASEPSRPVMVTGFTYDLEGAAADLCDEWAAAVKLCITFSDGNQKFDLNAKFAHLMALADRFRKRQSPMSVSTYRSDTMGKYGDDSRFYNKRLPRLGDY